MMRNKNITLKELSEFMKNPPENLKVKAYYENEEGPTIVKPTRKKKKYTLDQIGDALFEFIKTTNARFDRIEARLDYVVKANNLKDIQ